MRHLRRIAVAFVGGTVLAVGVVMVVLPGPAVVVIPAGLAILATEFPWARRLLHRVRSTAGRGLALFRRRAPAEHPERPADAPPEARRLRAS
ncbi:MAG TPA: PGPGW domain-containing protein [Candidatus Acidoferrum sp.]|nr:PGPGW domain-containing protein [Candidatus Acidoferrum sp.]